MSRANTTRFFSDRGPAGLPWWPVLIALLPLAACDGDDDDDDNNAFVLRSAQHSVDATSELVVAGNWLVYLADEASTGAAGTDLNADLDTTDDVAVAVYLPKGAPTVLRAALAAASVGNSVFLVVDEAADGTDWNGDTVADDLVLVHWSGETLATDFVDVIDPAGMGGTPLVAMEGARVYYAALATPTGDDTTLRYVTAADPLVPFVVQNGVGLGTLSPLIIDEVEGLVFLLLDETVSGVDHNGDLDTTDAACLALLDGTDDAAAVVNLGVAMSDAAAPHDADLDAATPNEWLVAFLVNEAAQGGANLNDPLLFVNPLVPDSCAGTPDADTTDDVLFYGRFSDLAAGIPAVNTGLAGSERVVAAPDFVATISPEDDTTCDLNEDGDTTDMMARWVEAIDPTVTDVAPPRDPSQMHALFDVPGGSHGLSSLSDFFVIVADEAADNDDINGDTVLDDTPVGFLDPTGGFAEVWTFQHPETNPGIGFEVFPGAPATAAVSVNWMAPEPAEGRLGLALMEESLGFSVNVDFFCDEVAKDADALDSLPVWADFEGAGPVLDFDGQGYALHETDPGVVQAKGWAFYRVSEANDATDYNNDGDTGDVILFRNPQTQCNTFAMGTSSSLPGNNPAVVTDAIKGGVFLASEFQAEVDFNNDGDTNDLVPRFFVF